MQLTDYVEVMDPDVIRLKGHRIGLEQLVELYQEGYSVEQIQLELPTLRLEEIYGAITYYLHNQTTIDAYMVRHATLVARDLREADAREPSPAMRRIRELLAKRQYAQQQV